MKTFNLIFTLLLASSLVLAFSTVKDSTNIDLQRTFGIFKVLSDNSTIEMDGTIGSYSLSNFNSLKKAFPDVSKINIRNCDGSSDDEINLQLSARIHREGINTHVMDNGEISSGGVDFFIAGVQRSKGNNTKIGVHSWSSEEDTATDFPEGHRYHLPYIKYYVSVGFTQQQAEDFYYFTINAAPADAIHWMTEDELFKYNILTR
ncbi:hypothetical protein [Bizionia paragorgiae]|jgi:hypothetical protein|uniref:Alpha/beta hydrolase n=1 Tax=Bizionia paragorgiae TaxID=283786 RepID=A0A1H4BZ85_BIZPA|nr:hypothetical protein [Bizionia paragorgiae]MDX1270871.1 hypothetical protein [Bizionia paragorgiae]SEA53468.1 hypothetical protein SAMN04487990_11720 [Bizionia paragorgiae]